VAIPAELFVDTSAWYPIADAGHPDHPVLAAALRRAVGEGRRIVTTNLVVAETQVLLLRRVGRRPALRFAEEVRREPMVVERGTGEVEERAVEHWLRRFQDQPFSFTDAVSFAVMERRGIREALALDHHFTVAGFDRVP
jgi:uncharacterized protein